MKKLFEVLGRIAVGVYSIVVTYLAGWVVALAVIALGLHFLTELVVRQAGYETVDAWWSAFEARTGVGSHFVRMPVYGGLLAAVMYLGRGVFRRVEQLLERMFDGIIKGFRKISEGRPIVAVVGRGLLVAVMTAVVVPFVVQPTLVGANVSVQAWMVRVANLADGTASRHLIDSVAGTYRQFVVEDVESVGGVGAEDWDDGEAPPGEQPDVEVADPGDHDAMMDRWDPFIERETNGDARQFAFVKAFMQIESAGRQFAVSHTGCAGLMQFCSGTARRSPFREIFGTGAVYACGCNPDCHTPDEVRRALETGERDSVSNLEDRFPCRLSDARFEPEKSIRAGHRYIVDLAESYNDNLYLMYIGYNSGPGVADEVFRLVGRNGDAQLDEIERHLADALEPHFGDAADSRANSLVNTHLPRLRNAYDRYHQAAVAEGMGQSGSRTARAPRCELEDHS